MKNKKIFIIIFCVVTVILLLPIFCYAYGTLIFGGDIFDNQQKSIVFVMALLWPTLILLFLPLLMDIFDF